MRKNIHDSMVWRSPVEVGVNYARRICNFAGK